MLLINESLRERGEAALARALKSGRSRQFLSSPAARRFSVWLDRMDVVQGLVVPIILAIAFPLTHRTVFHLAKSVDPTGVLNTLIAVQVGLAALAIPLLVLMAERHGDRDEVPATFRSELIRLRGTVAAVYMTLVMLFLAYIATLLPAPPYRESLCSGAALAIVYALSRLTWTTITLARYSDPAVVNTVWFFRAYRRIATLVRDRTAELLSDPILRDVMGDKALLQDVPRLDIGEWIRVRVDNDNSFRIVDDINLTRLRRALGPLQAVGQLKVYTSAYLGNESHEPLFLFEATNLPQKLREKSVKRIARSFRTVPLDYDALHDLLFITDRLRVLIAGRDYVAAQKAIINLGQLIYAAIEQSARITNRVGRLQQRPRGARFDPFMRIASDISDLLADAPDDVPVEVVDQLINCWENFWALAFLNADESELSQLCAEVGRIQDRLGKYSREKRARIQEGLVTAPWHALRAVLEDTQTDEGSVVNGALPLFFSAINAGLAAQLRSIVRNRDRLSFSEVMNAAIDAALRFIPPITAMPSLTGVHSIASELRRLEQAADDEETIDRTISAALRAFESVNLVIALVISWVIDNTFEGKIDLMDARSYVDAAREHTRATDDHLRLIVCYVTQRMRLLDDSDRLWNWTAAESPARRSSHGPTMPQEKCSWAFVGAYASDESMTLHRLPDLGDAARDVDLGTLFGQVLKRIRASTASSAHLRDIEGTQQQPSTILDRTSQLGAQLKVWQDQIETKQRYSDD